MSNISELLAFQSFHLVIAWPRFVSVNGAARSPRQNFHAFQGLAKGPMWVYRQKATLVLGWEKRIQQHLID